MKSEPVQLREFARSYTAAWCSQDPSSVAAHFSPDGSLIINDGTPAQGRAAITEAARSFMTSLPDMQVVMDNIVIAGDGATYHWTLISVGRGLRISGFEQWTIGNDGLITRSLGHFDSEDYTRQLELHG